MDERRWEAELYDLRRTVRRMQQEAAGAMRAVIREIPIGQAPLALALTCAAGVLYIEVLSPTAAELQVGVDGADAVHVTQGQPLLSNIGAGSHAVQFRNDTHAPVYVRITAKRLVEG